MGRVAEPVLAAMIVPAIGLAYTVNPTDTSGLWASELFLLYAP